jgi:threonyl-tRNA synthetase
MANAPADEVQTDQQQQKEQITLTLPDGSERTHPQGVTGYEAARDIGAGLARAALGVKVDGEVKCNSHLCWL